MSLVKQSKDYVIKFLFGKEFVPSGLFDISQYFRNNKAIYFDYKEEGDEIIAISKNFRYGKIITSAKGKKELDVNIKDAILTAFEIPSAYKKEVNIKREGEKEKECYAFA